MRIKRSAVAWAVVAVDVEELDEVGLHRANLLAFRRALAAFGPTPTTPCVTASSPAGWAAGTRGVEGRSGLRVDLGGQRSGQVRTGSAHDRAARDYPDYGFDVHKGYTTAAHRTALSAHGPMRDPSTSIHHRSPSHATRGSRMSVDDLQRYE